MHCGNAKLWGIERAHFGWSTCKILSVGEGRSPCNQSQGKYRALSQFAERWFWWRFSLRGLRLIKHRISKAGATEAQRKKDGIACGAKPRSDGKQVVKADVQKAFQECMFSKGYKKVTRTVSVGPALAQGSSGPVGTDDPAYRKSISRNAAGVTVDASCQGLFVPKVAKELFRGAVPVWNIYFLNNSKNRYRVSYDISYRKAGKTYFGRYDETLTHESSATVRPGKLIQLPAMRGASDIKEITEVNVFRCTT